MRRQFDLPEKDRAYLDALGLTWEAIVEGGQWLLVYDFPVPAGYNLAKAIAALLIPPSYDDGAIDMVYFHPALVRLDGKAIGALTDHPLDGKVYQRWSRHRTSDAPWRTGVDDVGTHLILVDEWLQREFRLR